MKNFFAKVFNGIKITLYLIGKNIYKRRLFVLKICFWTLFSLLIFYPRMIYLEVPPVTENCCAPFPLNDYTQHHDTTRIWRDKFFFKDSLLGCDSALRGTYAINIKYDSLSIQQDSSRERELPSTKHSDYSQSHNIPINSHSYYVPLSPWSEALFFKGIKELKNIRFSYLEDIIIGDAFNINLSNFSFSSKISSVNSGYFNNTHFLINTGQLSIFHSDFYKSSLDIHSGFTTISECNFKDSSLLINGTFLSIDKSKFDSTDFTTSVDSVSISNSKLSEKTSIYLGSYCKLSTIDETGVINLIRNASLEKMRENFINYNIEKLTETEEYDTAFRTKVVLSNIDFNKIKFSPKSVLFIVDTSSNQPYYSQFALYKQIIEYYNDNKDERKIYDVQFQKLVNKHEGRWLVNFLEENFNYYGYEPNRVWIFTGTVFLIFLIINNLLYPFILKNSYRIRDIEDSYKTYSNFLKQFLFDLAHSFLYSLLIFWIFKIDLDKLKATNLWLTTLVVVEHVIALVLLAFIASTILNNPLVF